MSAPKHTPGPWTVEDRLERLLIWADGSHDYIASIPTIAEGADDDAQEAYEEEQHANAALIEVAPQLLEVVRRFLDDNDGAETWRMARAAIAKLDGK